MNGNSRVTAGWLAGQFPGLQNIQPLSQGGQKQRFRNTRFHSSMLRRGRSSSKEWRPLPNLMEAIRGTFLRDRNLPPSDSEQLAFRHYLHALCGQVQALEHVSYDEARTAQTACLTEPKTFSGPWHRRESAARRETSRTPST